MRVQNKLRFLFFCVHKRQWWCLHMTSNVIIDVMFIVWCHRQLRCYEYFYSVQILCRQSERRTKYESFEQTLNVPSKLQKYILCIKSYTPTSNPNADQHPNNWPNDVSYLASNHNCSSLPFVFMFLILTTSMIYKNKNIKPLLTSLTFDCVRSASMLLNYRPKTDK